MGNPESPFNLPLLAYASGATYVARWTILHSRDLTKAIEEAFTRRGFSFIEVLAPCPTSYGRRNKKAPGYSDCQERSIARNDSQPAEVNLDFGRGTHLGKRRRRPRNSTMH
jgi:2-oxoglutarate ferredoxin oxidoreductase subunit beta